MVVPWLQAFVKSQNGPTQERILPCISLKRNMTLKHSYQHSFHVSSVAKSCLCDPVDCSPPGSSVHGISQARALEQVAISFSRGSSWLRNRTHMFCIGRRVLYCWATREAQLSFWDAHFQQGFEAQSQSSVVTRCMFYAKMPLVSHSNTKCKNGKKTISTTASHQRPIPSFPPPCITC